jgi:hypothetical protein
MNILAGCSHVPTLGSLPAEQGGMANGGSADVVSAGAFSIGVYDAGAPNESPTGAGSGNLAGAGGQ